MDCAMSLTPVTGNASGTPPVLECRDLTVTFAGDAGEVRAVNGVDFRLERGECLGVVGESGSGKSQGFLAVMGLLAENGKATGSVKLNGREILNAPRRELDEIRGNEMAIIFQDPMSTLTPFLRIGDQMSEGLIRHRGASAAEARERVLEVLEIVRIPAAKRRFQQYPHELSGGMRQRIVIAQALLCKPKLLIADEPTTALDVTVQAEILEIFRGLKAHTDTSIVMITHDMGVVAGLCDRVAVMYAGNVLEEGSAESLFYTPRHPYTEGLLRSIPSLDAAPDADLKVIPGQPPNLLRLPNGCRFRPRCDYAMAECAEHMPALGVRGEGHRAACHLEVLP
jgi:oligopeptide transport system ATP-binding protein